MKLINLFESDFEKKNQLNEVNPHDFDSDEDYYAAVRRGKRKPSYDDDYDDYEDEPVDDESYYEKSLRSRGLGEGKGNVGNAIKSLYQKIYAAGDDEIEYFYNDSPVFAQYWDEYEGDLDSIIAEVDPGELQVMLDELESYVQQANLAEGSDDRKQNALWAQITAHEKAAKQSKDLKRQHHLKMADQLRSQLKTSDNEQGVAEDVRLPYPVRSEKLGRANMELLIRAYNEPTSPRTTLSFGDRILELDRQDVEAIAHYYDNVLKDDQARWNFISGIMSDPDGLTDILVRLGRRKAQAARQPGLFQEADKKKEDDLGSQVRDVALQRAISRAKADFPAAGSGMEALAKDFMRGQEQDQKSFDQLRRAERKQDQMLAQISKIDQEQEQEIQGLEQQNSGLAKRLQQLQLVNSQLEKKLAAMSGRKFKAKDVEPTPVSGATTGVEPVIAPEPVKGKSTKTKNRKTKQAPQAKIVPPEKQTTPSAISSIAKQLTTQHPDVLEPAAGSTRGLAPRFNTTGAQDVVPRNVANNVKQNISAMGDAMVGNNLEKTLDQYRKDLETNENKEEQKPERPEADYGDEYQAMVQRVGQKAKQGPRKTVWDPVKKVYKTVPVNPVKEQEPGNRAGYNAIKSVSDWAEKLRTMQELQKDVNLMADPEARAAVQQRLGELLKFGIQQGYTK